MKFGPDFETDSIYIFCGWNHFGVVQYDCTEKSVKVYDTVKGENQKYWFENKNLGQHLQVHFFA